MNSRIGRDGVRRCFVALWLEEPVYAAHQTAAEEAGISLSEHLRRLLHKPDAAGVPLKIGPVKIPMPPWNVQRIGRKLAKLMEQQKELIDCVIADPPFALGEERYSLKRSSVGLGSGRRQVPYRPEKHRDSSRNKRSGILRLTRQKAKNLPAAAGRRPDIKPEVR
jgi:hypothetical protein